ncbi:MAG: tyrosine-protein phosphatase [Candidatus Obscuribacterales bacterium]|nr:tyrosine-protein phosphatase [Candidatus Obscuribacterales bacterium]
MKNTNFLLYALLCLSLNSAWAADPQNSSTVSSDEPKNINVAAKKADKPKEDLPNFHEVHPFLYRSGEPTEAGLRKLKEMGIKTLIDLRAPSERAFDEGKAAEALGMKYIMLTMTSAPPTQKQVDKMLKTIKEAKDEAKNGSVLVHCAHGSDRTGCMLGIWRVTQENWSYDEAYKEMRKYWFTPKFTKLADAVKIRAKS